MRLNNKAVLFLSVAAATLTGCSSMKATTDNRDPFENYNRKMYAFNDSAYEVLTPLAYGYDAVIPDAVQSGIFNIFQNLREPGRIVNDVFQGEWSYAGDDSIRFLTNTTIGLLGFFDPADSMFDKEMRYHQSFAVTLHKWGVYDDKEASPYVVWPLLGPGTLEDLSTGVDALFNPLTYILFFAPVGTAVSWGISAGVTGTYYVNQGVAYLPAYNNFKEVSIDPYIAMRNAYLQNYDYGMSKILKQELQAEGNTNTNDNDRAVLGVLGLDAEESENQVAKSGDTKTSTQQPSPVPFKSKLASVNKASQVDEAFDIDQTKDSSTNEANAKDNVTISADNEQATLKNSAE